MITDDELAVLIMRACSSRNLFVKHHYILSLEYIALIVAGIINCLLHKVHNSLLVLCLLQKIKKKMVPIDFRGQKGFPGIMKSFPVEVW